MFQYDASIVIVPNDWYLMLDLGMAFPSGPSHNIIGLEGTFHAFTTHYALKLQCFPSIEEHWAL